MNHRRALSLVFSFVLGLIIVATLLAVVDAPTHAQGSTLYVAPGGDCGGAIPCYATVQAAVDAAVDGDTILVSTGVYSDVHAYPRRDLVSTGVVTQVVYVDKSLTVRGGYTTPAFAEPPDPLTNPAVLDARQQGRVLYVTGNITLTVEGLYITGGDATGQSGHTTAGDYGGGIYAVTATVTFSNNHVFSNTADHGGGLATWYGNVTLHGSQVTTNTATFSNVWGGGGGLYANRSTVTICENSIAGNTTEGSGGGLQLTRTTATVKGNSIMENIAQADGGGLYLNESAALMTENMVQDNSANDGGGFYLWYSPAQLDANSIISNTANHMGGGLFLQGSAATFTNTIIAGNEAAVQGSGLRATSSTFRLLHSTIARNVGGDGSGIYVNGDEWWGYSTASLMNTIVVSQTVGVFVRTSNTANLEATMWGTGPWANIADWSGGGTVSSGTVTVRGLPHFAHWQAGDYHISVVSAALDAGTIFAV